MNCLLLTVWPGDWEQFIPSLIATFVGFILALIGDYFLGIFMDRRKNRIEVMDLFERISVELTAIKTVLERLGQYSLDKNPLKTPVWDEAINAGMISLIPVEIRGQLFTVYKKINELNSWYEIKTNYYFNHFDEADDQKRYNKELNQEIEMQEKLLLGKRDFDKDALDSERITIDIVLSSIGSKMKKKSKR